MIHTRITSLLSACALTFVGAGHAAAPAVGTDRPSLYHIDLQASNVAPSAKGAVDLRPASSPFGFALTVDGHFIFDIVVQLSGLPPASALGPFKQYAVWATTADLKEARLVGVVKAGHETLKGSVSYNKFLIFVTAEGETLAAKWKGPVILRGYSPSALLENIGALVLMNGGQTPPE